MMSTLLDKTKSCENMSFLKTKRQTLPKCDIAVIGGSGIYGVDGLENKRQLDFVTPFGKPSCKVIVGTLHGEQVCFIARHNTTHNITPTEVPYRANIYALKLLGVKYVLSFAAVGSLQEDLEPGHVALVDSFIDRTRHRPSTFFGNGVVAHASFGDPVCPSFNKLLKESIESLDLKDVKLHENATYVCMEGPLFSTRAESNMYRTLGGSVIGMTAIQEAKLCREAEMSYALVSTITDYDCWHPGHDNVTLEMVLQTFKKNGINSQLIVKEVVKRLRENKFESKAFKSMEKSILTRPEFIPEETKRNLDPIIGKYVRS